MARQSCPCKADVSFLTAVHAEAGGADEGLAGVGMLSLMATACCVWKMACMAEVRSAE